MNERGDIAGVYGYDRSVVHGFLVPKHDQLFIYGRLSRECQPRLAAGRALR